MKKPSAEQALQRAKALAKAGNPAAAQGALSEFLERFPNNRRVQAALKDITHPSGAAQSTTPPRGIISALMASAKQGKVTQAGAKALNLTQDYPNSAILWDIVGVTHATLGKLDQAEAAFRRVSALNPASSDAHYKLGALLLARKKHTDAITALRNATDIKPDFGEAQIALGTALLGAGEVEEAEDRVGRGLRLRPKDAQAHNTLGIILLELKLPDQAIPAFRMALEIDETKAKYWLNLAKAYRACGAFEDAIAAFSKAAELRPGAAEPDLGLASVYSLLDRVEECVVHSARALDLDPSNEKAAMQLASVRTGFLCPETLGQLDAFVASASKEGDPYAVSVIRAQVLRHRGEVEKSFRLWCAAKARLHDTAAVAAWRDRCATLTKEIGQWTPRTAEKTRDNAYQILCILGPSRSGKTTVETLLAECPSVKICQETWKEEGAVAHLTHRLSADDPLRSDISQLLYLTERDIQADGIRLVTLTNPFLLDVAHLVCDAFDNALFVFVERDEIRTAAEIFTHDYNSELPFTNAAADALEYVRWYRQTGRILARKMGPRALTVTYADLVGGQLDVAQLLEDFAGTRLFEAGHPPRIASRDDASIYEDLFGALLPGRGASGVE